MHAILRRAAKFGLFATVPICLFSFGCGSIHSSQCGPATFLALLLSIPAMAAASITGIENPAIIIPLFLLATFVWVTGLALAVLWVHTQLTNRRERTTHTDQP